MPEETTIVRISLCVWSNPSRRSIAPWLLAVSAVWLAAAPIAAVQAEGYPERTIKTVVPFPAGGPTDVAARLVAQSISNKLGQGVIVENHPGAGGRIGAKVVAGAAADGYTLLLGGTNVNAIAGAIYKDLGFDPIASFAPIAAICADSLALAVSPGVPAGTFQELVTYAKANPGKLKYGATPGIYTQFAGEYFKVRTGTDILFVPYKGGAPAITDVLGGHIEMTFGNKSTLLSLFKDNKLKALAVTSAARWPELPQTPTMTELGIPGFPSEVLFGLLAPAGTPPAIVQQLNQAIEEGLHSPQVRSNFEGIGVEARTGTPEDFAAALEQQAHEWKTVIDAIGGVQIE
jgi:tripartite-type tricarboxylate transporter receptor subunit TctC